MPAKSTRFGALHPTSVPTPLDPRAARAHGLRCYGWGARKSRGAWKKVIVMQGHNMSDTAKATFGPGWAQTNAVVRYDVSSATWLQGKSQRGDAADSGKPGLVSVRPGDWIILQIDSDSGRPQQASARQSSTLIELSITYLQAYDQNGLLLAECIRGCECAPLVVDTLMPTKRFATLNTTRLQLTQARNCRIRFSNISPPSLTRESHAGRQCTGPALCTKLKIVSLSVAEIRT